MTALIKYDAACKALAEAKSVDEVKSLRDKSLAIQAYAKQAKNRQLAVDAGEIRFRAERRLGEMLKEQPKAKGSKGQLKGRNSSGGSVLVPPEKQATLSEIGIDKKLSSRAQKLALINEEKFEGMIGEWRDRVEKENERVTTNLLREGERQQKKEWKAPPVPKNKYPLIYADPPWRYEHVKTENRAIENQYPTMSLDEIKALEIPAAEDCILFLWATAPKLAEAVSVMEAWGFTYRTCAVWDKKKIGMGYYFRQQHELLLVGMRGKIPAPEPKNRPPSVYLQTRAEHSAKPEYYYSIIESMYPKLEKIELFSRNKREGWAAWGNQSEGP